MGIGVARFSIGLFGPMSGALLAYKLSGGKFPNKIKARFKIFENGIHIHEINEDKSSILLWNEISGIYKSNTGTGGEVLIKMVDDRELIISAPFFRGTFLDTFYTQEFISFVKSEKNKYSKTKK